MMVDRSYETSNPADLKTLPENWGQYLLATSTRLHHFATEKRSLGLFVRCYRKKYTLNFREVITFHSVGITEQGLHVYVL